MGRIKSRWLESIDFTVGNIIIFDSEEQKDKPEKLFSNKRKFFLKIPSITFNQSNISWNINIDKTLKVQ